MMTIWRALAFGAVSTLSMDLLTGVSIRLRLASPLPPNLIGRWFASVARAHVFHADIAQSSPVSHELLVALPVHYAIGTVLAALFVGITAAFGWPHTFVLSLAFGIGTSILPWLLMFPAMGYGFFGASGPEGTSLFVSSLISHAFFGVGLWLAMLTVRLP